MSARKVVVSGWLLTLLISTACSGTLGTVSHPTVTVSVTPCIPINTSSGVSSHHSIPQTPASQMPTLSPAMRQTQEARTLAANPGNPTGSPAQVTKSALPSCPTNTPVVNNALPTSTNTPAPRSGG